MKEEIKLTEVEQLEEVVQEENQQPVIIQPKIIPPRVLLEILVMGTNDEGSEPTTSKCYHKALLMQTQIDNLRGKDKFRVRILWRTMEGKLDAHKRDEMIDWLVENASCKYYIISPDLQPEISETYVKDLLKNIKDFEKSVTNFKESGLQIKKK
jgi:hypothetical protein